MSEYRNDDEKRKYGSDYNKFVDEYCRRDMTVINIDCVQWDFRKRILRFIESKHKLESMRKGQKRLLHFLANLLSYCNKAVLNTDTQFYLIIGNPPYKSLVVKNLITDNEVTLQGNEVIQFGNLELSP